MAETSSTNRRLDRMGQENIQECHFSKPVTSFMGTNHLLYQHVECRSVYTHRFKQNGQIYVNFTVKRKFGNNLFRT